MITATATLRSSISVTATLKSTQVGSCPDATVQVNGVDVDTVASGGTYDQAIHDSAGADVGTDANPSVVGDATVENSDSSYSETVKAEGNLVLPNITFTDSDGSTSSVPSVQDITATPCVASGGSISVALSDSSPSVGDTITITATASDFTPDSYLYFAYDEATNELTFIAEQASNIANWTISIDQGEHIVYVLGVENGTPDDITAFGTATVDIQSGFLLDVVSIQGVAFSTRRLKSSITTSCFVRRSLDNSQDTFGYIGEDLDEAAVLDFVGAGNGFQLTLYDQNGSNDATQPSASLQPQLVISGTVQKINGKPAIYVDEYYMDFTPISVEWAFIVAQRTGANNAVDCVVGGSASFIGWGGSIGAINGIYIYDGISTFLNSGIDDTNAHQMSAKFDSSAQLWVDGVLTGTANVPSATVSRIGARTVNEATNSLRGLIGEIILTTDDQASNRSTIESNQSTYWGTP
jgi:hypothetical protein